MIPLPAGADAAHPLLQLVLAGLRGAGACNNDRPRISPAPAGFADGEEEVLTGRLVLSVVLAAAEPLASGYRVQGRRSRSRATRPQGAPWTRWPGAGQWNAEEDGRSEERRVGKERR